MTNLQKVEEAFFKRRKKPLAYRIGWHGSKGGSKRWFPEYAALFPHHLTGRFWCWSFATNVLPEHKLHFVEFMDQKLLEWNRRNCFREDIMKEPYFEPTGDFPNGTPQYITTLGRLGRYGFMPQLYQKWLKNNPDKVSEVGKRARHGFTKYFHRYALSILARLDSVAKLESEEAEKLADDFRDRVKRERQEHLLKKKELKIKGLEIAKQQNELCRKRWDALRDRKDWLREWRKRTEGLFLNQNQQPNRQRRKQAIRDGRKNDISVCKLERDIKTKPQKCYWCSKRMKSGATIDHITPIAKGGKHAVYNIVPACLRCNVKKLDAMPDSHEEMPEGFATEMAFL